MTTKDLDIIAVGSIAIDEIIGLDNQRYIGFGGSELNTLVYMQNLGLKTGVVTVSGDNKSSKECIDTLKHDSIETCVQEQIRYSPPKSYFEVTEDNTILIKERGEFRVPRVITPEIEQFLKRGKALLIGAQTLEAIKYVEFAAENGMDVYLTLQMAKNFDLRLFKYMHYIKAIFGNRDEEKLLNGYIKQICNSQTEVFITLDKEGSRLHDADGLRQYSLYKTVEKVVDRTGAGDAFAAAAIYSLIKGIFDPSVVGNISGAYATTRYGARCGRSFLSCMDHILKTN